MIYIKITVTQRQFIESGKNPIEIIDHISQTIGVDLNAISGIDTGKRKTEDDYDFSFIFDFVLKSEGDFSSIINFLSERYFLEKYFKSEIRSIGYLKD